MALSGSVDFTVTRDDLIKAALQHVGAIGDGETPSSTQLSETSLLLNMLIKHWQADDIQLWVRKYGYILPTTGISYTQLGAEGGNATASYAYTTLSASSASTDTTITVSSTTGIMDTYFIGIEQDDNTIHWTTVNGAPSGSVVTITDQLTAAATSGNAVYCYQTKINRPVTVLEAFRRTSANNLDTPMVRLTEQEYNNLSSKNTATVPIQWYYDDSLGISTSVYPGNGTFYHWPRFNDGKYVIVYRYTKPFDDLDSATNNVEFPQMWFLPIMLGLAWLIAGKNGLTIKERQSYYEEMLLTKRTVMEFDQEKGSLFLQPYKRYN